MSKTKDRKELKLKVGDLNVYEWEGKDLDDIIGVLQGIKKGKIESFYGAYCQDWDKKVYDEQCAKLKKYHRFSLAIDGCEDVSIEVWGYRWETDAEKDKRENKSLEAQKKAAIRREKLKKEKEEFERKEFARLAKKFAK